MKLKTDSCSIEVGQNHFLDFSAAIGHLIISSWHYPDTDIYLLVSFLPYRQIDGNGGDLFYAVLRCKRNCLLLC